MLRQVRISAVLLIFAVVAIAVLGPSSVQAAEGTIIMRVVNVAPDDVLNIRKYPSSRSTIIGIIPPNASGIEFLGERASNWLLVEFGNTRGWVHRRYVVAEVAGWSEQNRKHNGPYSAIAAGPDSWGIVGGHETLAEARQAALEVCNTYVDDVSNACTASAAGRNELYFAAGICDSTPFTTASTISCAEAKSIIKRKARGREPTARCRLWCEQGGKGWPYGRH